MTWQSRAENWQRWARGRHGLKTLQAESMEKLYRSLNWGDIAAHESPLEAMRPPVDVLDAERVEDAWRALEDPYRTIIRSAWILGQHPRVTCRKAGIHHLRYDEMLSQAMCALSMCVEVECA